LSRSVSSRVTGGNCSAINSSSPIKPRRRSGGPPTAGEGSYLARPAVTFTRHTPHEEEPSVPRDPLAISEFTDRPLPICVGQVPAPTHHHRVPIWLTVGHATPRP
jgi:hypothetical protein